MTIYGEQTTPERAKDFSAALRRVLRAIPLRFVDFEIQFEEYCRGSDGKPTVTRHAAHKWVAKENWQHYPKPENISKLCAFLESKKPDAGTSLAWAMGWSWPPTHRNNLPDWPTSFIGRETELAEVRSLVTEKNTRLCTLVGPAGAGKTRLALKCSAGLLDEFKDGVWFVDLAPITKSNLVMPTIAHITDVREVPGQALLDTMIGAFRDKCLLLILDNFEQVADASVEVAHLISRCPSLKVLATSRVPLKIKGEQEYPVAPFPLPDIHHTQPADKLAEYEVVRLFIDRAGDVKPNPRFTAEDVQNIAKICVRLDGLPLSVELAAAKVRILSTGAILARLSTRLRLLTGGGRDLPVRQQTLHDAIEWSYDLLSQDAKRLFWRLAVFQGGSTLEAIEAVCYGDKGFQVDVLDGVESLVSSSLLQFREDAVMRTAEGRYWMLETIHEFAREKLSESGEEEELQRTYSLYFMKLAESIEPEPHLTDAKQATWLASLEAEHDNFRAVLGWSLDHRQLEVAFRLSAALWLFWRTQGHLTEGRRWLNRVLQLEVLDTPQPLPARSALAWRVAVLKGAGTLAYHQGDYAEARDLFEEGLTKARELDSALDISYALHHLGNIARNQGDYASARSHHIESLTLRHNCDDKLGIAHSLNALGIVEQQEGRHLNRARKYLEDSFALFSELKVPWGIAQLLTNLGNLAEEQHDYPKARTYLTSSIKLWREIGNKLGIAYSLESQGVVSLDQQDYTLAHSSFTESLIIRRDLGDKLGIAHSLEGFARLASDLGQYDRAVVLLGAVDALNKAIHAHMGIARRRHHKDLIETLDAQLDRTRWNEAWSHGLAMSIDDAIGFALE